MALSKKLADLPLLTFSQLRPNEGAYKKTKRERQKSSYYKGRGRRGNKKWALGHEDQFVPTFMQAPPEPYYADFENQKEYPPLSLLQLQRLIDLNVLDPKKLIDLPALCNTYRYRITPEHGHYGVHLTDEGIDEFKAKIDIEVQFASEPVIAAIERNGGTIRTKYYDMPSVIYCSNVEYYFRRARPIPRVKLPSSDVYSYYSSAKNRGYLASIEDLNFARFETSQKFGFENIKRPFQVSNKPIHHIFEHLKPGWIVDIDEKCILKPKDKPYTDYYEHKEMSDVEKTKE